MEEKERIKETVKSMQNSIYGILCDVDDLCRKKGIMYFLSGGTCLGAVRHHGFIPWDDDADIMLPRAEYEKFVRLFSETYGDKYGVGALELDNDWCTQYARIWVRNVCHLDNNAGNEDPSVGIDVFPIDGLPGKKWRRKFFFKQIRILRGLNHAARRKAFLEGEGNRLIKRCAGYIARPFGARFFALKMDDLAKKYIFDRSQYVGASLAAHYGERETIAREKMSSAVYFQFVDREFPVPFGYDEYLTHLYGDYMTVPKEAEERGYTHLEIKSVKFNY